VDILSDSAGLWVLYTNQDVAGRIILLKIDSVTMETHFIAYTHSLQTDYMNCFMVCSILLHFIYYYIVCFILLHFIYYYNIICSILYYTLSTTI